MLAYSPSESSKRMSPSSFLRFRGRVNISIPSLYCKLGKFIILFTRMSGLLDSIGDWPALAMPDGTPLGGIARITGMLLLF